MSGLIINVRMLNGRELKLNLAIGATVLNLKEAVYEQIGGGGVSYIKIVKDGRSLENSQQVTHGEYWAIYTGLQGGNLDIPNLSASSENDFDIISQKYLNDNKNEEKDYKVLYMKYKMKYLNLKKTIN